MKKFDFLTKQLVDSFSYTTITKDRKSYSPVKINGRQYVKYGTLQAVTIVGNLYEDHSGKRILVCGISKQHPHDSKVDKQIAYEVAQEHALSNPEIVINNVPSYLNKFNFSKMMSWYVDAMKLEFVKTSKEIQSERNLSNKYN